MNLLIAQPAEVVVKAPRRSSLGGQEEFREHQERRSHRSEPRDHLRAEPGIVAVVESAAADEMDEFRDTYLHLVAIGIFRMRQDDRFRDVGNDDVRHYLLANPF